MMSAKKKPPRILAIIGEAGFSYGRSIGEIDEKLLRRQAATVGKLIENKRKGYAIAPHLSGAETKDLEGVWALLHAIADEFKEIA